MAILKARENSSDTFTPVATMGVGNASQSQRGLMTAQDKVKLDTLVNLLVPVGVILTFASDIDPNDIYQGTTWEKIEGKFLLGSSSDYVLGSTGGEAEHTLTVAELAQHSHPLYKSNSGSSSTATMVVDQSTTKTGWASVGTGNQGSSQPHNNMPPYEVVNYWKRTA